MKIWVGFGILNFASANLYDRKNVKIRPGNSEHNRDVGKEEKHNSQINGNRPVNRLQCFYHPRWINCRSRAQMQLRPAPGKGIPMCPYGGCQNGKCVENCLFGRCRKQCQCHPGWEGVTCNKDINDCRRKVDGKRPCQHRCVNLGGYYRCLCEEGFELEPDERTCKRVLSKCDLKNCEMDCRERYGTAQCLCPKPGLQLAADGRTCVDVNECGDDGIGLCRTRETCVNIYGGYRCDCEVGYARQGQSPICTDVDECSLDPNTCPYGTKCRNVPGFYQCIDEERDELPEGLRSVRPAHLLTPQNQNFREEQAAVINYPGSIDYNQDPTSEDYLNGYLDYEAVTVPDFKK